MPIWDAFFDATLDDYLEYLKAAAAGAPSVFLLRGFDPELFTVEGFGEGSGKGLGAGGGSTMEAVAEQLKQQQQGLRGGRSIDESSESENEASDSEGEGLNLGAEGVNEYVDCLGRLVTAIRVISSLTIEQRRRPLLLIGMEDVPLIAAAAMVKPEDVLGVLGDFYMFKRLGMYLAMDALQQG